MRPGRRARPAVRWPRRPASGRGAEDRQGPAVQAGRPAAAAGNRTGRWWRWWSLVTVVVALAGLGAAVLLTARHQHLEEAQRRAEPALRRHRIAVRREHVQLHPADDRRGRRPVRQQHQRTAARHDEPGHRTPRTSSCCSVTPMPARRPSSTAPRWRRSTRSPERADVLVAVRVTVTDLDGNNAPSSPIAFG